MSIISLIKSINSLTLKRQLNLYLIICYCFITACGSKDDSTANIETSENSEINQGLIPAGGNLISCKNWSEFVAAIEKAAPGDVIQLKNGTYSGNITFSNSGTEGERITIIPESRGSVIINGESEWSIEGKYITIDGFYFARGTSSRPISFSLASSYCRFINSAIIGWNLGGNDTRLISIRGTHNEVGHCMLREKNTSGMMLEVVRESSIRNDHRIHHVYFGYFQDPGEGNGFETVRIGTSGQSLSSSYTTLENCVFERCDGESEIISSKSGHNIFRKNTFLDSDGALTLRHGHDNLVEGNFFINTREDKSSSRCNGIRVIGERQLIRDNYFLNLPFDAPAIQVQYGNQVPHKLTQYDHVKETVIENNTVYNCDKGVILGASKRPDDNPPRILPPNGIFRNNLIVSSRGESVSLEIEAEVLSRQLFTYANDIISGKDKTEPAIGHLPTGVKFMNSLNMAQHANKLYYPTDPAITAGVQDRDVKPLYLADIVPVWVKEKIEEDDPDFVDVPW